MERETYTNVTNFMVNEMTASTVYVKLVSETEGTEENRAFTHQAYLALCKLAPIEVEVFDVEYIYLDESSNIVRDVVVTAHNN